MLAEQRQKDILTILERQDSVTVTELTELLNASESTIRRDIVVLDKAGKLTKVFGGAVALETNTFSGYELTYSQKSEMNLGEKYRIAEYAASLIEKNDFVFLDAGTTIGCMIEHLPVIGVTYVTNAISMAQKLASKGALVYLLGGELKGSTEAIVGNQAVQSLQSYYFTKSFIGVNGISKKAGLTTPSLDEATIKQTAIRQSRKSYVLADSTKFNSIMPVKFAEIDEITVITDKIVKGYEKYKDFIEC